jgi:hypothetical protein
VAWILIVPPQLGGDGHTDKAVPLAQWEQMGSYNSGADCRADCESFIKRDEKEYKLSLGSRATPSAVSPDSARQARLKSTAAALRLRRRSSPQEEVGTREDNGAERSG